MRTFLVLCLAVLTVPIWLPSILIGAFAALVAWGVVIGFSAVTILLD